MRPARDDIIWWEEDDPSQKIVKLCKQIESPQRRARNVHHLRLYGDQDYYGASGVSLGGGGAASDRIPQVLAGNKPKLSINVIRNMVNAATSMICRARPRPFFLTTGGDFDLQEKAKKRTQFTDAVFNAEGTHDLGARAVQHANILGTGCVHIVRDYESKKIHHELVYIGEMLVDEAEGVYGCPRNYYRVRAMDRLVLKQKYPDKDAEIDKARPAKAVTSARGDTTDEVIVIEAWHLPSGSLPPAQDEDDDDESDMRQAKTDGRYAVVTEGGTLWNEPYNWDAPPFAFMRWEEDPLGFYGTGIPSELTGPQYEINETIRNIQANWWAGGSLKVLVARGSKVVKAHLSNDLRATVVEYTGQPPSWVANDAVAPGLVQYLQMLIQYAYEVTGISQLSAQSQTPFASMSGRARLVHENSESLRFLPVQRRHERFHMNIALRTMEAAADINEKVGDFAVIYSGKEYLDPIKYSDIEAGSDTYDVQCMPTSILPSTPAGKLEFVENLEARGYIDPAQSKKLLDFPDIKRELDFDTAPQDLIDARLSNIMKGKEYIAPTPEMDLEMGLKRSLQAIMISENRNVPRQRIELLRKWRDTVQAHMNASAPPTPAPPAPGGMPPTGPGLPAPAFPDQVPLAPQNVIATTKAA